MTDFNAEVLDNLQCDRCGSAGFDRPAESSPGRFRMIEKVFGKNVLICKKCGAVRYPNEVQPQMVQ